jgi:hypothetical protein
MDALIAEEHVEDLTKHAKILPFLTMRNDNLIQFEGLVNLGLGFLTIKSITDTAQLTNIMNLWNIMMEEDFETKISPILEHMFEDPAAFVRKLTDEAMISLPGSQRFELETLNDLYGRAARYLESQA